MRSKTLTLLAAASLLGAGSGAAAQSAAPLSLARAPGAERAGATVEGAGQLRGAGRWIIGAIVLGLVIWGIVELVGNDEEDFPVSA